jgi:hypothetical protein
LVQVRCAERAENARRGRTPKKAEETPILPFSFAPRTLNVKHDQEIVPDPTPAKHPRGLAPTVFAVRLSL